MNRRFSTGLISILLSVIMLISATVSVFASDTETVNFETEMIPQKGLGMLEEPSDFPFFYSLNGSGFSGSYYNQLDDYSKSAYDTLYNSYLNSAHLDTITVPVSKTFNDLQVIYSSGTLSLSQEAQDVTMDWALDVLRPAYLALLYDHPELCWLTNVGYRYGTSLSFAMYPFTSKRDVTVTGIRFVLSNAYTETGDKEDMDAAVEAARAVIDPTLKVNSDYEIIKAVHDYICDTVSYTKDSNLNDRIYQTPYSAFYDGCDTVCAGYSKAFKMICDSYGIPCVLVSGTGNGGAHMWNYVLLEDSWYAVDTTWDDQGTYIYYGYYLKGSASFSEMHTASGSWVSGLNFAFQYPLLSYENYVHSHSMEFVKRVAPTESSTGVGSHYLCTSCALIFSDSEGEYETTLEELSQTYCDVTGDGKVNSIDVLFLKRVLNGSVDETETSDITGDGKITSFDLARLKRYISG